MKCLHHIPSIVDHNNVDSLPHDLLKQTWREKCRLRGEGEQEGRREGRAVVREDKREEQK